MTDEKRTTEKQLPQPTESSTTGTTRQQRSRKQPESDASFWTRMKAKWPKKEPKEQPEVDVSTVRWVRVRMFPIWLRLLILLVLIVIAAILGAIIGFSVIGDGSPGGVFHKETWKHIFDIMNGK